MAPLAGIRAHFHQLLHFQEVTHLWHWSIHNVIPACLVDTSNFQSYTSHKLFLITICFHDSTHLPIIPGGVCFLQDRNISKFKFLLVFAHFFLSWSDCKNSFLQRHQNSFNMYWNHLHLLLLYKLGLEKSPGGSKIIFDFTVQRLDGDRSKLLVRSLMWSVVLQVIPHQMTYHVFGSGKTGWNSLIRFDFPKHHPYGWHKEGSFPK